MLSVCLLLIEDDTIYYYIVTRIHFGYVAWIWVRISYRIRYGYGDTAFLKNQGYDTFIILYYFSYIINSIFVLYKLNIKNSKYILNILTTRIKH